MKAKVFKIFVIAIISVVIFLFGMLVHKNKIWPYNILKDLYKTHYAHPHWSVGIYTGTSPFLLSD